MDKVLLVGINAYPQSPLNGCVNDEASMASMAVQRYKFKEEFIRLLVDSRATTDNILAALEWLVDVQPGDRCLFHFSGHGVQVATRDWKQEIDGLDECLCPVDFDWNESHMIRDKQLYKIFRRLPKNVKFGWVNDSCHSGDLTRAMPKPEHKPRTIPVPVDIAWDVKVAKRKYQCIGMAPDNDVIDVNCKSVQNGILDVGFVSGCRSDQTSMDAVINGLPCGAMTYFFIRNLNKLPKDTPLDKVVEETGKELAANGFTQCPQAEGLRKNKPFLG